MDVLFGTVLSSFGRTLSSKIDDFMMGCNTIVWSFTFGFTFFNAINSGSKSFSVAFVLVKTNDYQL